MFILFFPCVNLFIDKTAFLISSLGVFSRTSCPCSPTPVSSTAAAWWLQPILEVILFSLDWSTRLTLGSSFKSSTIPWWYVIRHSPSNLSYFKKEEKKQKRLHIRRLNKVILLSYCLKIGCTKFKLPAQNILFF